MIQIKAIEIKNIRGIRNLSLTLDNKSFAIHGPNGTGKSGVVDAIDFALTGKIKRLSGEGMNEIPLAKYGPHIDALETPELASVELKAFLTGLEIEATITRDFKNLSRPKYEPNTAAVKEEFEKIAAHPEIALSRRQIMRFIIATAKKRSDQIEELLQLKKVKNARAALKTAFNTAKLSLIHI